MSPFEAFHATPNNPGADATDGPAPPIAAEAGYCPVIAQLVAIAGASPPASGGVALSAATSATSDWPVSAAASGPAMSAGTSRAPSSAASTPASAGTSGDEASTGPSAIVSAPASRPVSTPASLPASDP